jgi:hypothetical protein
LKPTLQTNFYSDYPQALERAQEILLLVLDVDGVLTDGKFEYTSAGKKSKTFGSYDSEALSLATDKFNIKFIILNNDGYLSIKNTQTKYFNGRVFGTSGETGLYFPKFKAIADAFELGYEQITTREGLLSFQHLFEKEGPMIIDCLCKLDQEMLPAQALKDGKQAGLHDMFPFLSDEELKAEMKVSI